MPSEAIRPAQIAADATVHAAWVQGWFTIAAGICALAAGALGYFAVLKAANRQTELAEQNHRNRVAAYRVKMSNILEVLKRRSFGASHFAWLELSGFRQDKKAGSFPMIMIETVPELGSDHWENHALLGEAAVAAISRLDVAIGRYIALRSEVIEKKLIHNSFSGFSPPTSRTIGENIIHNYTSVVVLSVRFAEEIQLAVAELDVAMRVASRRRIHIHPDMRRSRLYGMDVEEVLPARKLRGDTHI